MTLQIGSNNVRLTQLQGTQEPKTTEGTQLPQAMLQQLLQLATAMGFPELGQSDGPTGKMCGGAGHASTGGALSGLAQKLGGAAPGGLGVSGSKELDGGSADGAAGAGQAGMPSGKLGGPDGAFPDMLSRLMGALSQLLNTTGESDENNVDPSGNASATSPTSGAEAASSADPTSGAEATDSANAANPSGGKEQLLQVLGQLLSAVLSSLQSQTAGADSAKPTDPPKLPNGSDATDPAAQDEMLASLGKFLEQIGQVGQSQAQAQSLFALRM